MNDERYKQLMKNVGLPDSQSLLLALRQAVNETEQEFKQAIEKQDDKINTIIESLENINKVSSGFTSMPEYTQKGMTYIVNQLRELNR